MASTPASPRTKPARPVKLTVQAVIEQISEDILHGTHLPGQQLHEISMAGALGVSRNTLREAFRGLVHNGLLDYFPHRGVFVRVITAEQARELYRSRRIVQVAVLQALEHGELPSQAVAKGLQGMRNAVERALEARVQGDWMEVGSQNYGFHQAMFDLADSEYISKAGRGLLMQTRVAFFGASSAEHMHASFVELNVELLDLLERKEYAQAIAALRAYLDVAEARVAELLP
ncbi:GntR family transcriptional regulator [Corynebacterium sp. 35RC1]|nr:GntR family transcriptional regulator [Corynebacterium sp. 35RC1]